MNQMEALVPEINRPGTLKFEDLRGHEHAKRGLKIAAAGMHNILLIGPAGSGKTTLAHSLATILPEIETEAPPFREPAPSVNFRKMAGGGKALAKGEVALAHGGVLFLDELTEFRKDVLRALIQPTENRLSTVSDGIQYKTYSASLLLMASMEDCPCGQMGSDVRECMCKPRDVKRHRERIPRDLYEGFELVIEVRKPGSNEFLFPKACETSDAIRTQVVAACNMAKDRQGDLGLGRNAEMGRGHIEKYCRMDGTTTNLMKTAMQQMDLPIGKCLRILKVARTIADLAGDAELHAAHLAEALQYQNPGGWMP